jgi:hypothetical protein
VVLRGVIPCDILVPHIARAMEAVFDPLRLKCANMWHYSIVPSRSEILLMYKLHSMIFPMHWSRKKILKGTFVCSNFQNLGGNFRHREAVFDLLAIFLEIHPIYCSCWSQTSTLYYVLVSINNYVAYYQLEHKYSQTVQQSVESYQIN